MLGFAKTRTTRKANPEIVQNLYMTVMTMVRQPVFYTRFAVPDTTDGRYDLMCLILSLTLFRVQQIDPETAQALFDWSFKNTELGLREAGVGDLGVPKHMKRMLEAFYGRAAAYYEALEQQDQEGLAIIVARNLYNSGAVTQQAREVAEWVRIVSQFLGQSDAQDFLQNPDILLQLIPPSDEK